jgi:hypothetical protein
MTKWPVNKTNNFLIATDRDTMNLSDWEIYITDLASQTVSEETDKVTVAELIIDVPDVTGNIGADSAGGTRIVHLDTDEGSKFKAGDKIKIPTVNGDDYREIRSISGDDIVLYTPLSADVKADTDDNGENDNQITLVGNTGDYSVEVVPSNLNTPLEGGKNYQVMVQSRSAGIDIKSDIFHATPYNEDELGDDLEEIKNKLDLIQNGTIASGRVFL